MALTRRFFLSLMFFTVVVSAGGCLTSNDDLLSVEWQCEKSSDCGDGWQCEPSQRICVEADDNKNGVFDDHIVVGTAMAIGNAPFVPGAEVIGQAASNGLLVAFSFINRSGGIHGRRIDLEIRDDEYNPDVTKVVVEELIGGEDRKCFALVGTMGTNPSLAALEIAMEKRVIYFFPGTGAIAFDPDPPNRYVFNVRPRFSDETEQLTEYLINVAEPRILPENIAHFGMGVDDIGNYHEVGLSGFEGVAQALLRYSIPRSDVLQTSHTEHKTEIGNAVTSLLHWMAKSDRKENESGVIPVGVVISGAYDADIKLIPAIERQIAAAKLDQAIDATYGTFSEDERARLKKVNVRFAVFSSAGLLPALLAGLSDYETVENGKQVKKRFGAGMILAHPMPDPSAAATGVDFYRRHLEEYNEQAGTNIEPDLFSLEGYVSGLIFAEALKTHGRDITTESFVTTLEQLSEISLGIGVTMGFSEQSHQALTRAWGTLYDDNLEPVSLGFLIDED